MTEGSTYQLLNPNYLSFSDSKGFNLLAVRDLVWIRSAVFGGTNRGFLLYSDLLFNLCKSSLSICL